jgi:hypothetical protein
MADKEKPDLQGAGAAEAARPSLSDSADTTATVAAAPSAASG